MNRPIIRNSMSEGELYRLVYSMDDYISELENKSLEDLDTINDLENQVRDLFSDISALRAEVRSFNDCFEKALKKWVTHSLIEVPYAAPTIEEIVYYQKMKIMHEVEYEHR